MSRRYVLDGACLKCTLGSTQGKLKVTSQSKLYAQGKKLATDKDKQVAPTFGSCKASSPPPPCVPDLQQWKKTSKKVGMGSKKFVMEDSIIQCSKGGICQESYPEVRRRGCRTGSTIVRDRTIYRLMLILDFHQS